MGCVQSTDNYNPYDNPATVAAKAKAKPRSETGKQSQKEQPGSETVLPQQAPDRSALEKNVSPSQRPVPTTKVKEKDKLEFLSVYEVGKEIGNGAFATVFVGTNKIFNKKYAIKKIDRSKMLWGDRDALTDEISNLKAVREGPHIVKLYEEYYEQNTYCYLVLELMDGGELFDRIIEKKTFSEKEAREVTRCMLDALAYMHSKRVVHRDLKPENLLLSTKGRDTDIKLADFGFAKKIPIVNACRTLCGTPGYLAPEILERWPSYDTKCDLWSVGVILFLLLGGYLPFEDEDEDKVFERTRNGMYEFHPHYWGGVSEEAKELVTKFLTINPSKRFSAQQALNHKYMVTMNEQALRQESVDVVKMEASLTSGKQKLKAAINAVVVANRLQDLSDDFNKYLEKKRGVEPTFQQKLSVRPNTKSHTVDSATGMPFGDFYLLGELLGEGGFASVFQATHKTTHERHACKIVVHSKLPSGAQGALKDEIEALKLLRGGPHIVRLHDVFETPDTTYMIMEEMKGGELLQRIVEKEVYTEREARQTVKILFDAIDYCHKKKIAHRDIKPENLLLVKKKDDTSIKIADFGFAKKVTKKNCLRTLCGTAAYVAPEVLDLRSKGYDERADMWSCGVVTYILLGGYAPFEGPIEELARTILNGDYEFHDEYWSSISSGAKNLVASLLQVNPDRRITAEEALQNEWMTADEETLTIKDLSVAQRGIRKTFPVEKVRGVVKAIVAANKLTSLGDSFKRVLDTNGSIKRNTDGHVFEKSLANSGEGFDFNPNEPHEEDSSSGKPFDELYKFGDQLGAGTLSTVTAATHIQSNKSYAIKCVRREDLHHSDAVALQDEISALKALAECPYIVKFYDVFDEVDNTFLVLERMEGGDLIDRIIEKAHYTESDAREVCKQLLLGVEFCHSKRIANRNLKPENLLLVSKESDTDVKINDFGYAKKVLYPNSLRTQCGTEGYVAPEILEHRPAYDVKCDMWSLGVIIYIVLGGYRPFRGTPDEVMKQIRYGNYEFHPKYWNHVSSDAKDLVRRMLTVDTETRISATDALQHRWIAADESTLGNTDLTTNQDRLKEFKPKAKLRQVVKLIIATHKLQSLGTRYRAFQDF